MTAISQIETFVSAAITDIQRPTTSSPVDMRSSAMEVFTDFTRQHPMLLEQGTSIAGAREIMLGTHTKMFLVIDRREEFRGIISLEDLLSDRVARESGRSRMRCEEMTVEQVMVPRSGLRAIEFADLRVVNIGEVLSIMKWYGQQHLLVVIRELGSIRGIVSAHTIARRLHQPVVIKERAVTFSEICQALA